ncbi:hypothetical protein COU13_00645 [Candidatus Kaiserbacteria bacterium CG10_big_fil_rev_8_21_14_0_10_43_70]|uniref:Transcriptional repressor PaaX-like central Cas2-like domain-containing protein n=1 Tax=Candidatus Kaiserbacteria bacterium CG10_big_fil_rev_8_21_14_0_10_43_70 TaxID=1974605 RepID=A0A2H0UJ97_9BACT|nr:MAG: hypothetical protein COU13_00645 [Candidatus Kaiserbacteria bacterium CG10_big_fil_rev_8_21_14_0_10_43_70]
MKNPKIHVIVRSVGAYKRREMAKIILKILGAGIIIGGIAVAPNMVQVVSLFDPKNPSERRRIWRSIKHFEQKGDIRIQKKSGKITLTSQGKEAYSKELIWDLQVKKPLRWDGKWRLVAFDIPAKRTYVRHALRQKLDDLGFALYQRSLYIFPYDCRKEISFVVDHFKIRRHVCYIEAEHIEGASKFIRHFDLA